MQSAGVWGIKFFLVRIFIEYLLRLLQDVRQTISISAKFSTCLSMNGNDNLINANQKLTIVPKILPNSPTTAEDWRHVPGQAILLLFVYFLFVGFSICIHIHTYSNGQKKPSLTGLLLLTGSQLWLGYFLSVISIDCIKSEHLHHCHHNAFVDLLLHFVLAQEQDLKVIVIMIYGCKIVLWEVIQTMIWFLQKTSTDAKK